MDELEEAKRAKSRKILFDAVENNEEALREALFIDLLNDLEIRRWFNRFKQWRVRKKKIKQLWRVFISEWNLCSSERQ